MAGRIVSDPGIEHREAVVATAAAGWQVTAPVGVLPQVKTPPTKAGGVSQFVDEPPNRMRELGSHSGGRVTSVGGTAPAKRAACHEVRAPGHRKCGEPV